MLVRVPELEIISAYLPKYTSFVLIKITKTRYTNNNTHLNNKNIKICDLNPIFQKKIVFRKNRTPHCWVLLVFCNLYLQFIAPINLRNKCIDLRLFSKYLRVPLLRPLRSMDDQGWILRLQPWNFGIISESVAANLKK